MVIYILLREKKKVNVCEEFGVVAYLQGNKGSLYGWIQYPVRERDSDGRKHINKSLSQCSAYREGKKELNGESKA